MSSCGPGGAAGPYPGPAQALPCPAEPRRAPAGARCSAARPCPAPGGGSAGVWRRPPPPPGRTAAAAISGRGTRSARGWGEGWRQGVLQAAGAGCARRDSDPESALLLLRKYLHCLVSQVKVSRARLARVDHKICPDPPKNGCRRLLGRCGVGFQCKKYR